MGAVTFTYGRYCRHCGCATVWQAYLRRYSTFLGINCLCRECRNVAAAILVMTE